MPRRRQFTRRDVLRQGATAAAVVGVAGAVAWSKPLVETLTADTISSHAGSPVPGGLGCSYVSIVFTYQARTYAAKIEQGTTTCVDPPSNNTTSCDESGFSVKCNGATYDNRGGGGGCRIRRTKQVVNPYPVPCDDLFEVDGSTITAAPGVAILFAIAHDGSFKTPPKHFDPICPPKTGTQTLSLRC